MTYVRSRNVVPQHGDRRVVRGLHRAKLFPSGFGDSASFMSYIHTVNVTQTQSKQECKPFAVNRISAFSGRNERRYSDRDVNIRSVQCEYKVAKYDV